MLNARKIHSAAVLCRLRQCEVESWTKSVTNNLKKKHETNWMMITVMNHHDEPMVEDFGLSFSQDFFIHSLQDELQKSLGLDGPRDLQAPG